MPSGDIFLTAAQAERRGWPRLKVNWGIRLFRLEDEAPLDATLENISSGGVTFLSTKPFRNGERLSGQVLLPVETRPWGNGAVMLECELQVLRSESDTLREYRVSCEIKGYRIRSVQPEAAVNGNGDQPEGR